MKKASHKKPSSGSARANERALLRRASTNPQAIDYDDDAAPKQPPKYVNYPWRFRCARQ